MPSRPEIPVRGYSFGDFSSLNPATQQPGQRLDQEYDRVLDTIDQLAGWMSSVLDDAGGIKAGVFAPLAPAGFTYRGDWSGATAYVANDGVSYEGSQWIATAPGTNQPPPSLPTTSNAYWSLFARKGDDSTATTIQSISVTSSSPAFTGQNAGTGPAVDAINTGTGAGLRGRGNTNGVARGGATAVPDAIWSVYGNAAGQAPAPPSDTTVHVVGDNSNANRNLFRSYGAATIVNAVRFNGTLASPSALADDNVIFSVEAAGWGTAETGVRGRYQILADENWTATAQGTYQTWSLTFNGTTTLFEGVRLTASAASTALLSVSGSLRASLTSEVVATGANPADQILSAQAGVRRSLRIQTNGVERWRIETDTTSESGSNNGANLRVRRYSDAGSDLGDVATLNRASGVVDFNQTPTVGGSPIGAGVPAGSIIHYLGTAAPTGYLKANGALVSRTTYASLFAAIGTTYGAGDGSTTFALPDFRGEFVRGLDDGRGVDSGRALATAQAGQNASHSHTGTTSTDGAHAHEVKPPVEAGSGTSQAGFTAGAVLATLTTQPTSSAGSHSHTFTTSASGGAEARPRNLAALICIKF